MRWQWVALVASAATVSARRSLAHAGKGVEERLSKATTAKRSVTPGLEAPPVKRDTTTLFLTANTTKFAVNGSNIPEVDFDVGESYAGSLPISEKADEESNLFWWFFPSTNAAAEKEILIWLNGGPGCSSFEGLLQENGPFLWQYGTFKPYANPWSWHTLTNVIWVEQPVGTGFSTGKVTATSEEDVAAQFMGFWKNFVDTFAMQGYKVYIAGESYAGAYVPYIASAFLDAEDTTYYDLDGILIYDPVLTWDEVQEPIPTLAFVEYWGGLFPFNDTYKADLKAADEKCGYTEWMNKYLVYPPEDHQPNSLPGTDEDGNTLDECWNIYNGVFEAISIINPCFDIYQVSTTCPVLWDVLGFPGSFGYLPDGATIYFDRADVKEVIHAPNITWEECASGNVFVDGVDTSLPSGLTVLPGVIERTNNVIIGHGALDMILLANGSLLAIQNMSWNGAIGFQSKPVEPFYVPYHVEAEDDTTLAASGVFGTVHTERGLTYVGVDLAGHMIPQYAPTAAHRQLEFLLGRVDCMNCTTAFTTQPDVPQSSAELGYGTAPQGWSDAVSVGSATSYRQMKQRRAGRVRR